MLRISTFALGLLAATRLAAGEITVFAASSLTESLKEIATAYQAAGGDKVNYNFAASNVLVQQIQAGAPADVFFSADEAKMDALQKAGLIAEDSRKDLLGNTLVVIVPVGGPPISKPSDLAAESVKHLSLGDPKAVPAGICAKAWLSKLNLWDAVAAKVVPAENVRAAMAVVESGNAEAGIVYKTDAAISKKVTVALEASAADAPKIIYPVAMIKDTKDAAAARKFIAYLADKQADVAFTKAGFTLIK